LPSKLIIPVIVDDQGNIWIGTLYGLVKYDGTDWTVYNSQNSGMPDDWPNVLAIDSQNSIWIGGDTGLIKFDGTNWTIYDTGNSGLPDDEVYSLAFDAEENIWIGTLHGGLAKFDGTSWTVYDTGNSPLPNDEIYALTLDAQGVLWIGTDGGGLVEFDGSNWNVYDEDNSGLPDNDVRSLIFDIRENLWIGTFGGGLAVYKEGGVILTEVEKTFTVRSVSSFSLSQNYPNPFNPSTKISFTLPHSEYVTLKIYDLIGQEIETIISEQRQAGEYTLEWCAKHLSSGVYLYQLRAGEHTETRKLVIQK
jgi:ligand-binding sensor domain-containing protein